MNSHGHWDIYFAPFIIDKFDTTLFFRYLSVQESEYQMYINYSNIFLQLCSEQNTLSKMFTESWYENQLEKLINEEFSVNEIQQLVYSGVKNPDLERLLIGLMGWREDTKKQLGYSTATTIRMTGRVTMQPDLSFARWEKISQSIT